ncbi:ASCH domain-containing protein [Paracoccus sp. S1E-3]|uniref:ASCH domain-containing protein n=1 Tax=Paracoccus sp. S1E-3 TaxID=2756130 RepID=UPI0015EF7215|nr:ASCH domain-containing protein [Paracoccus sp. S1E-3]MBA4491372.1 ASCH domain-containing protein [Paracoccus sp. S1E-3]
MEAVGFKFGDSRALNERLLALVRTGAKTATCGALRDFGADEPLPEVGRRDVALDWDGRPALLIETTEVTIRRFREVSEDFALAEGEGDFEDWKRGHIGFFTRNGGFDPEMELVCERFRLVEVLA